MRNTEPDIAFFPTHAKSYEAKRYLLVTFLLYLSFWTVYLLSWRKNEPLLSYFERKTEILKIIFGFNQTFYREIELRDTKARILFPPPTKEFTKKYKTFTASGDVYKGKGGELIKKKQKDYEDDAPLISKQEHFDKSS